MHLLIFNNQLINLLMFVEKKCKIIFLILKLFCCQKMNRTLFLVLAVTIAYGSSAPMNYGVLF